MESGKGLTGQSGLEQPNDVWREFEGFCRRLKARALPATGATVAFFVEQLAASGFELGEIEARLEVLRRRHRGLGSSTADPTSSEPVREALRRLLEVAWDHGDVEINSRATEEASAGLPAPVSADDSASLGPDTMPSILEGRATPEMQRATESFYSGVAAMLEAWITRSKNEHTQRSYRRAVMEFVEFLDLDWPDESWRLLKASVTDVKAWRDLLDATGKAPATLNHRLSALSGFYKFMREVAASELKLPIVVPNPAHAQFIGRQGTDPVTPTSVLSVTLARKLMAMPSGDPIIAARDRAIIRTFLYAGVRIRTACNLDVADFHNDADNPTLRIQEKGRGSSKRQVGIHFSCAEALREYIAAAGLSSGPLFRSLLNPKSKKLGENRMTTRTMARLLGRYFEALPEAMMEVEGEGGEVTRVCRYSPHSLRATTATLLDEAGVPIKKIQALLGHRDIRVTQGYIKLGHDTRKSASHDVPL